MLRRLLGEWKISGEIEDVVVSTWFGELEKYPDIATVISENDFFLVESPQPAVKMSGHAFHQSKSIHLALRHVPDGALVFSNNVAAAAANHVGQVSGESLEILSH